MSIDSSVSIRKELLRIKNASASRDPWAVLGIPRTAGYSQVKTAQRKWIRRLHPDRWYAYSDEQFRSEVEEALYQVQVAYFEALKRCANASPGAAPAREPIATPPPASYKAVPVWTAWIHKIAALLFRRDRTAEMSPSAR
jgi:hypothetical protein